MGFDNQNLIPLTTPSIDKVTHHYTAFPSHHQMASDTHEQSPSFQTTFPDIEMDMSSSFNTINPDVIVQLPPVNSMKLMRNSSVSPIRLEVLQLTSHRYLPIYLSNWTDSPDLSRTHPITKSMSSQLQPLLLSRPSTTLQMLGLILI